MADVEKAFLEIEGGTRVPCLFNPEKISLTFKNSWENKKAPGKGVTRADFQGSDSGTLTLELMFDTTAEGAPVTKYTGKVVGLLHIKKDLPGTNANNNNARPPTVTFHWGNMHSFPAVVTDASLTFTYFSSTGVPLRASMSVTLMQYEESDAFGPQNPTSGTPHPHRVHRVQPGETLDRISAKYYGDPTGWRTLAGANGIEDPLAIRAGTLLAIPDLGSS